MSMAAEFRPPHAPADNADELGFPLETPLAEMTDAERANYWRRQAKKYQSLLLATKSVQSLLPQLELASDRLIRAANRVTSV